MDNVALPWSLTRITAPAENGTPDGFTWFTSTVHVAATGGDTTPGEHSFVLIGDKTYAEQWGNATISVDAITPLQFYNGIGLGPLNNVTLDDGYYYSFHVLDPLADTSPASLNLSVFKTSAPPISVSWSGQTQVAPTSEDPTVISITTSLAPSAEEKIYLRWTTNTFIDSTMVPATGSGTAYSATISPQPANTLVQYSIVTSTVDLTPFTKSGTLDALTLAGSVTLATFQSPRPHQRLHQLRLRHQVQFPPRRRDVLRLRRQLQP